MTPPWYALFTLSERRAHRALAEIGVETYRPTRLKWCKHGRQKRLEPVPLLSSYIIARIPDAGFRAVLACEYVVGVVSTAGYPRPIPDHVLNPLRELVASGRLDEREPATKARPRSIRRKGLRALEVWFEEAKVEAIAEAA